MEEGLVLFVAVASISAFSMFSNIFQYCWFLSTSSALSTANTEDDSIDKLVLLMFLGCGCVCLFASNIMMVSFIANKLNMYGIILL